MTTQGYQVEEYSELDFEHVVLESESRQYCSSCLTDITDQHAGIHQCPTCGSFNHIDIEV